MQTTAKMLSGTINPYPEPTGNAQQRPDSNVRQGPSGRGRGSGRTNPSHRHTHTSSKTRHQRNTKSEDLNILSHAQGQLRSHLEPASTHSHSPYQDPALSHAQPPPQQQQQYQQDPSWHGPRHPFAWPPQPLHPQQRDRARPHSASDIATAPAGGAARAAAHPWLPASTSAPGTQAYPLPPASNPDATTEHDEAMDEDTIVQSIETEPPPHSYSYSPSQFYPKTSSPMEGRESWVRRAGLKREVEGGDGGVGEGVGEGKRGRVGL